MLLYDDSSGDLHADQVWRFTSLAGEVGDVLYGETVDSNAVEVRDCPIDKLHVTKHRLTEITLTLHGDAARSGEFVPVWDGGFLIVTDEFASRLTGSGLSGFELRKNVTVRDGAEPAEGPSLTYLEVVGDGGTTARRWKILGAPNACPHCKLAPMVCTACGHQNWPRCSNCANFTLFRPEAPAYSHPRGFRLGDSGSGDARPIVEASTWDGSDFFYCDGSAFVNNRAKEWLERNGARPIRFEPALLSIPV
jgi:hypothetical protein